MHSISEGGNTSILLLSPEGECVVMHYKAAQGDGVMPTYTAEQQGQMVRVLRRISTGSDFRPSLPPGVMEHYYLGRDGLK